MTRGGAAPIRALAVRLVVLGAILALTLLLELRPQPLPYGPRELRALYVLIVAGAVLALVYGGLASRLAAGLRLERYELFGDGLLITALVYCSGGSESLFVFLYNIWIVHAAVRAGTPGSTLACAAATLAFNAVVWGPVYGWLPPFMSRDTPSFEGALLASGIHTAGFVFVALLTHVLAEQVKSGRAELHELGEIHRRIVDGVSSGLLTTDTRGRITSFNREAERITGHPRDEVLGRGLEALFPEPARRVLSSSGAEPSPAHERAKLTFTNHAGEQIHLGFSRSVLRNETGQPEGAILIFQDLTRVVEMEEQLRRSERLSAVGQLAAGLAHEIRNPLGSLSGAIELLAGDLRAEDTHTRRLMSIVKRETGRLNRLVSDFLDYARSGPGRREAVGLAELFGEMKQLLASGDHAALGVELDVPAGLCALGDSDRLRQVFWNLVLNAAESEPRDACVRIRARELAGAEPQVEVSVIDRGRGIPEDQLERIFEPFFTTKPKGTGLGLATVHRVVEACGGRLAVRSEPGQGTTVRVILPRAPLAPVAGA
jgi:two-component system, NtrC family, sensor histidine kinase PilS